MDSQSRFHLAGDSPEPRRERARIATDVDRNAPDGRVWCDGKIDSGLHIGGAQISHHPQVADRRRVIATILRRPFAQVGFGVVAGGVLVQVMFAVLFESRPTAWETASIGGYALLMMSVCLLACVAPARRALRVEPAGALRAEH